VVDEMKKVEMAVFPVIVPVDTAANIPVENLILE
jgi:hypothetical protein